MNKKLKHTIGFIAILIFTLFNSACFDMDEVTVLGTEQDPSTEQDSNMENLSDTVTTESRLFASNKVLEVRMELSNEAWQAILANPQAEEYQEGNIIYDGIRVDNVAIRTKGQSSLMSVASDPNSNRYSFKIDLNHYVKGQDLLGLKKLSLNNGFSDPTFMRERLSYDLMRAIGLPTPRTAFVNLFINNKLFGLYTAVENVDEEFIKAHFEQDNGDLYKAEMGTDLLWKGDSIDKYTSLELKTNEDTSDHSALLTMLDELNNGSNYESVINVDEVLRYLAVSTAMTNLDSYQGSFAQNYYLYEEKGIFNIIPWDFNMSFGAFNAGGGDRAGVIKFMIDEPTMGKLSDRPLIAKLLQNPDYLETYNHYINQLITGPLNPDTMEKTIKKTATLIRNYVYADPTKFYTNEDFEQSLTNDLTANPSNPNAPASGFIKGGGNVIGLISFIRERVASISDQLHGLAPANGDGSGNFTGAGGLVPGGNQPSAIDDVSPSYANQGDTDVTVTITLNQQIMAMFPSDISPLSVKIGAVEGRNISRNELEITAVFDIPLDESIGMKDVSIEFPAPQFPGADGLTPPDGFTPPPGGFTPPDGFTPPPGGFTPPAGGFPGQDGQGLTFTKAEIFEIRAMR